MKTTNIDKLISVYGLEKAFIALLLFPKTKYPNQALERVLEGKGTLSVVQLTKLANAVSLTIEDVQKGEFENSQNKTVYILVKVGFILYLDCEKNIATVTDNQSNTLQRFSIVGLSFNEILYKFNINILSNLKASNHV